MGHGLVVRMKAVIKGPIYGDRMIKAAQILILRARSWKKNMSKINISPPPCATVLKNPFRIRAAMKDSNVVAAAHHAVGGGGGEEEEVEEDWQSPCPCGKYDDDDAPGAKHENITNLRVINGVFTKAPDSRNKLAGMLRY